MAGGGETGSGREEGPERARVVVSGRVQGVFFRDSAREEAGRRGLIGWVRNLSDGRVEAVFEGPGEKVREMVRWCEEGPSRAEVEDVQVEFEEPQGEPKGFEVR